MILKQQVGAGGWGKSDQKKGDQKCRGGWCCLLGSIKIKTLTFAAKESAIASTERDALRRRQMKGFLAVSGTDVAEEGCICQGQNCVTIKIKW